MSDETNTSGESSTNREPASYTRDPKDIVTETAFRVDAALLGTRLASPWRRLGAMLLDLTSLGAVVLFKEISAGLFAVALAWIMWRVARPDVDVHLRRGWIRGLLRVAAVVTFIAGLGVFIDQISSPNDDDPGDEIREAVEPAAIGAIDAGLRGVGLARAAEITVAVARLQGAEGVEPATRYGGQAALAMYRSGTSRHEIEEALEELVGRAARNWPWEDSVEIVVEGAMARVDSARSALHARSDSLMNALLTAAGDGDTARVRELREEVVESAARSRAEPLVERIDRLEERLDQARSSPGIVAFLRQMLDDLGLGFSWLALYFTAFLKLWQGRTPGKRLLGLRVVKVRGGEIGWWDAFGRFGGYAASVVTGLVGFSQVFWDPNRQGLHDRIAGTVVIRE